MADADPGQQAGEHPLLVFGRPMLQADGPGPELSQQIGDPVGVDVRCRRQPLHLGDLEVGRSQFAFQSLETFSDALNRGIAGLRQRDEAINADLDAIARLDEDGGLLVAVVSPPL